MANFDFLNKNYVNLVKEFSIAKFKVRDQRSVFGFMWSFLSPFLMTNILFFLFRHRMGPAYDMNFFLYILIGTVTWNYFVVATVFGITSILNNGTMAKNVAFPKEILVFSDMAVFTFQYLFELLAILLFILFMGIGISPEILLLPFVIMMELLLITGITLFLSCAYVIYARDLSHVWNMITRMLFFLVPIFYPLSLVPERVRWLVSANPMTQIILFSRDILLDHKIPAILNLAVTGVGCAAIFVLGYFFFKRYEFKMVENV